jgi:hypothetical protein
VRIDASQQGGGVAKSLAISILGLVSAACGGTSEQPAASAPPTRPAVTVEDLTDPPDTPETPSGRSRPAPLHAEAALIPPGVTTARGDALARGEAALSFTSRTPPANLVAWYRSPARGGAFHIDSELQEGAEKVLSGRLAQAAADFTVRIAPGERGGTTAMVLVTGR